MDFRTPVSLPPAPFTIDIHTHTLSAGSCFAQHMTAHLADALPDGHVAELPNGTLYNPLSVAHALECIIDGRSDGRAFLASEGLWRHWGYSTKTYAPSRSALIQQVAEAEAACREQLLRTDVLLLTLSTDSIYELADGPWAGSVVANCHKQPAASFRELTAGIDECFDAWNELLHNLFALRPELHVVLTLSPYRYAKCGMHANALTKARLLLLIDRLCGAFPQRVTYFPAFEIITDELRDYRFYAPDMLHPSQQAADYVWERFRAWTFTPRLQTYAQERARLLGMMRHRPILTEGREWERFEQRKHQQLLKVQALEAQD